MEGEDQKIYQKGGLYKASFHNKSLVCLQNRIRSINIFLTISTPLYNQEAEVIWIFSCTPITSYHPHMKNFSSLSVLFQYYSQGIILIISKSDKLEVLKFKSFNSFFAERLKTLILGLLEVHYFEAADFCFFSLECLYSEAFLASK